MVAEAVDTLPDVSAETEARLSMLRSPVLPCGEPDVAALTGAASNTGECHCGSMEGGGESAQKPPTGGHAGESRMSPRTRNGRDEKEFVGRCLSGDKTVCPRYPPPPSPPNVLARMCIDTRRWLHFARTAFFGADSYRISKEGRA